MEFNKKMFSDMNTRINRVKVSLFVLFFVSFFVPVYAQTFNGTVYKVNIAHLNAGLFFMVFFLILMVGTVVVYMVKEEYYEWSYVITSGFMVILLLMLLLLKQDGSSLRLGFYLEVVFVSMIIIAHFSEQTAFLIIDKTKEYLVKFYQLVKKYVLLGIKKIKEFIDKKREKSNEEGEADEEIS